MDIEDLYCRILDYNHCILIETSLFQVPKDYSSMLYKNSSFVTPMECTVSKMFRLRSIIIWAQIETAKKTIKQLGQFVERITVEETFATKEASTMAFAIITEKEE